MTVPAPVLESGADTPVLPGLLYAVWRNEDLSRGWFRCVRQSDGRTFDELVVIGTDGGPDGVEMVRQLVYPEDALAWCLEHLHADLVWRKTGERVGLYADEPVDLDALPPQAKQAVVDARCRS
jgi:hypothetical protein